MSKKSPPGPPRPALVVEVMTVLQRRRHLHTRLPQRDLERRLPAGRYGTLDALRGAAERGLLHYDEALPSRAGRMVMLDARATTWSPEQDGQPRPLTYTWAHNGRMVSGRLPDWAKLWAVKAHRVPGGPLGWTLSGPRYRSYLPYIDLVEDRWRIVVAGEETYVAPGDMEGDPRV